MTLRDSSVRKQTRKGDRTNTGRLRDQRRRKDRRLLTESLEPRQLLAGPDLIGIQPNEGQLIRGGEVLSVSPRELVFRFDDQSDLDPLTLATGISITRAGDDRGFESATATTDLGTGGTVLLEFRATQSGVRGNGIEVRLRSSDRGTSSQQVLVSVNSVDRIVELNLNSNPGRPSVVRDVITAIENNPDARALLEVDQVSGSSLSPVGPSVGSGIDVVLAGANAAQFISDLGTNGQVRTRFIAATSGANGVGTTIMVSRSNLNLQPGQLPFVTVTGKTIQVILDSTPGKVSTASDLVAAINSNVDASSLVQAQIEYGNANVALTNTAFSPLTLIGATDTVVQPGFVGLGDTPHEVVFRFAEPLPQDVYQIEIYGSGPLALRNVDGESFADGEDFGVQFSLNNAPQVAAVVPTPVRRQADGTLVPELNVIEVYFNEDIANATDPALYEVLYTRDTVSNQDDHSLRPASVTYNATTRVARLTFTSALSRVRDPLDNTKFLGGAIRLRVGTNRVTPDVPQTVNVGSDPGDSFGQAYLLNSSVLNSTPGAVDSLVLSGTIENGSNSYGLQFPGGSDVPGVRNIRPEDPSRLDRAVPLDVWRTDGDSVDGITTVYYDFPDSWLGDDPNFGLPSSPDRLQRYFNLITEEQKQRIREVVSLYSEYLGVQFVETDGVPAQAVLANSTYVAIAVGEIYGAGMSTFENSEVGGVTVATRALDANGNTFLASDPNAPANLAAGNNLLVMDFQDFDASVDDQLGGAFFRGGMLGVGQLLGYGFADHLPQPVTQATGSVLSPVLTNEPAFPSPSDIVNGQYLYRPESNDVDLYRFTLNRAGTVNIQTVAERLQSASSLDTALRLYQKVGTSWQEIAANDDYFSDDSLIEVPLAAGEYIVGVSASGNTVYDPSISGTGIGGLTQGEYDLRITFESSGTRTLVDQTQVALDGDLDGRAGGEFNFWFMATDPVSTVYVDQSYTGTRSGAIGSTTNPYSKVNDAVTDAGADFLGSGLVQQVRVVGGTYSIGLDNLGIPTDGANLELPEGVQLVIDAGSTFLMRRSRIGVGSTTEGVDRSNSSIQVLGVPGNPVRFTSSANTPRPGDWGGIDIRGDIDSRDDSKVNQENAAVFLNHIQYADIQYGGGPVSIDGRQSKVSPIEMAVTRPTIINSSISNSADAAISATPDSFAETRFDEYRFQRDAAFTPDVTRIGPHIRGNVLVDNTINGLFVRLETRAGDALESLNVTARMDDTDIVHVLTDNLLIEGRPGGPDASIDPPSALLVRGTAQAGGGVTAGSYVYKLTFVNSDGYETDPSNQTLVFNVPGNDQSIRLTALPTVPQSLRDTGFAGRRLYRAPVVNGVVGAFAQVARLNSNDRTYTDSLSNAQLASRPAIGPSEVRLGRLNPGLSIDPGTVMKLQGSRIDVTLGAHLYAEGTESLPIVMTSLRDSRFGTGGSFETIAAESEDVTVMPGDWGGVYVGFGARASIDYAVIAGGGGATTVEGGFGSFNTIEAHQAELRVANSRFEENADGRNFVNDPLDVRTGRVGRGDNASGTIFIGASQPILVNNEFVNSNGPVMTFDVNSFTWQEETDQGRSTGMLGAFATNGNSGPLIQGNRVGTTRLNQLDPTQDPDDPVNRNYYPYDALGENPLLDQDGNPIYASLNGLEVRGGQIATEVVFDDVDIVHIVRDLIEVPNQHIYGGLRLQSDARGSLVVKFMNQDLDDPDTIRRRHAGIVVGGNLVTAEDQFADIDDRIGGSVQIVGHPDFPVVLTSLIDDTVGAGFTPDGRPNFDTDNNGRRLDANGDPIFILTAGDDSEPAPPPLLPLGQQYDRTGLEEFNNANLIDNDIDPFVIGFFEAELEYGGQVLDDIRVTYQDLTQAPPAPLLDANINFLYTTYIDIDTPIGDPPPIRLFDTMLAPPLPVRIGDDRVRSTGTFLLDDIDINPVTNAARRREVDWIAESFILNSRGMLYTTLTFETRDNSNFGDNLIRSVRVISYVDQGIPTDDEDILYSVGTPGSSDFRAYTINRDATANPIAPLIGFSHGGVYDNDSFNQFNAQYVGWAAEVAPQLLAGLEAQAFSPAGDIPNTFFPTGDPLFDSVTPGTVPVGQEDIATAFAWQLFGDASEARVTTFVEFLPSDPVAPFQPSLPPAVDGAGTWDGVTIREAASDANVAITGENEPRNIGDIVVNDPNRFKVRNEIPGDAQFLGELADSTSAGDNIRRLGFIVDGAIAKPNDLDVYSFIGEAGTQVWLDIDRTNSRLDTVIELIDANGNVRVLSDNSLSEARESTSRLTPNFDPTSARSLNSQLIPAGSSTSAYQDLYSTNARDAGMRLVLPGNVGQRFLYHVRVRSSNSAVASSSTLLDPAKVRGGLTSGAYQLQIRLQEEDVFAGTQIRYSDVRFAVNGVQIVGGPNHSPILADEYETQRTNDTLANAQRLGLYETLYDAPVVGGVGLPLPAPGVSIGNNDGLNYDRNASNAPTDQQLQNVTLDNAAGPLSSDRLAKSIAGFLDSSTDVDWYQFDVAYKQLTRDSTARYLSTVFDLDYADGVARADTSIYVFDALGNLVLVGTDSNVADDQPVGDADTSDLARGSFGAGDPFIGVAELLEGTYFVAVSNQTRVPGQLEQFFQLDSVNPLLRLEPIDSIRRIAEDHIGSYGGGTATDPVVPVLFDNNSIVPYSFDDVLLYVNTGTSLEVVNPFTGEQYPARISFDSLGNFTGGEVIRDIAFRANGELFGYTGNGPVIGDNSTEYVRIDTSNAALNVISNGLGLQTFHLTNFDPTNLVLDATSDDGIQVEAISIRQFGDFLGASSERGYLVGNRPIDRAGLQYYQNILYQFDDATGQVVGPTFDRSRFSPGAGTTPREVGQINTADPGNNFDETYLGLTDATVIDINGVAVPSLFDGDTFTLSNVTDSVTFELDQSYTLIADTNQPVRDGDAVIIDGTAFEFNTGARLVFSGVAPGGLLAEGTTVTVQGDNGGQTFEFVRFGNARQGNLPIRLVNATGQPRPIGQITAELALGINTNLTGVTAEARLDEVFFVDFPVSLSTSGPGVTEVGSFALSRPGAVEVAVSSSIDPEQLIRTLADAIRQRGISVSDAGTQLSLPTLGSTSSVSLSPSLSALRLFGSPGVDSDNTRVLLLPTDTAATLARRIEIAVQNVSQSSGELPNVTARPQGQLNHSIEIQGGAYVFSATGNLTVGGVANDGFVTGIEVVGSQLYGVTNTGGLYVVSQGELDSFGNRTVGRYVQTATDLRGINFSGLRAGPFSVENGSLSQILFGITSGGDIYAFNTAGELVPAFSEGRSSMSTGVSGAVGLDFSVVDFNLWHVTDVRSGDAGHGINPTFNGARPGTSGGSSLAFMYENGVFGGNYPSVVEQPTFAARLDGTGFEQSYNVPGGTKGVVQSNPFSLAGYAQEDLPTLYFNYFMETEAVGGRDALRVYVVTSDGVEHLVTTNNLILRSGLADDEFDDPSQSGIYADEIDTDTQPLFDATGAANPQWRQARVPLGEFAGKSGLSLRVEFSTAGSTLTTSNGMRVSSGRALAESDELEFVINDSATGIGESFVVELAPTVTFPSGKQLAAYYSDPANAAVITIDGTEYLLNDGTRVPTADQVSVDLLAGLPAGTTLASLSAGQIAAAVANQTQNSLPLNQEITNFLFDAVDNTTADPERGGNDLIYDATLLPYAGGNLTISGTGRLGRTSSPTLPPTNLDDVDMMRLEVRRDTTIEVDVDLVFNTTLDAVVRFFDASGNPLVGIPNPANDSVQYTATRDGVIYVGISGLGNASYDPRIPDSAQAGQIDSYTASVRVTLPSLYRADESQVEFFGGQQLLTATPTSLFTVTQPTSPAGAHSVAVSRYMSASEVAAEVQRVIANRFTRGQIDDLPTSGPFIRMPDLFINDAGPFVDESDRYAFEAGFVEGTENNAFEGVYLDDFVIGFAERGELATGATPEDADGAFVANGSLSLTLPAPSTSPTDKGAYQLEIRDGSEYVSGGQIATNQVDIQRFAAAPIVVPINGVPYGVAVGTVPVSEVIPAIQRPPFQIFNLPTIDVVVDATTGEPITGFVGGSLVVELDDNDPTTTTLVPLIELDPSFKPVVTSFTPVATNARFRTFDTNDRLTGGYSLVTQPASAMVDGASFAIFDSLDQLQFEFDIRPDATPAVPNPQFNGTNNPDAVVIEIDASDSAAVVASKIIDVLNSPNVQASLDVLAARSNSSLPGDVLRDIEDSRVNLYGSISFTELTPTFASVTLTSQRGDANRDRSQQGTIVIENSRFLFNSESGVSIIRDAEARLASGDQRDEFPVALTYPQNLLELNSEGLLPGVVVQNNVIGFNANNGIFITGIDGGGGAITTPVGFDKIVNNTLIGGVIRPGVDLGTQIFSGYLFPRGGISFADEVAESDVILGSDVDSQFTDAKSALSSPDAFGRGPEPTDGEFTLSLGSGGRATFRFTDNFLTGNNSPTPDLVIFESGASESVRVEISRDGVNYFFVGVASGLSGMIDIDQYGFDSNDRFAFVRVTDLVTPLDEPTERFGAAGADIDAIGALSTVPAEQYVPGSQGIVVTNNSGPTVLNNIVANFQTGIAVSRRSSDFNVDDVDVSRDRTVLGGNTYFRNAFDANGSTQADLGLFNQLINDFQQIFVDPTNLVFTPQDNVPTIDSSIDSLEERASLLTVRAAVGLPPIPILAPLIDLNGQLRVDDPEVDTPSGIGQQVFKDRGAEDRADEIGPRVTLVSPRANDLQRDAGQAVTSATIFDSFDIQLVDGITPADPSAGVGVNDLTASDGALIRVTRLVAGSQETETLVEGVDYRYAYEPADNMIRLTPIAGIWQENSVYTIEFLGREVGIIQGERATRYADGAITQLDLVSNSSGFDVVDRRAIELDTGIGISVAQSALTRDINGALFPNIQGQAIEVFDGQSDTSTIFELTTTNDPAINDAIRSRGAIPVRVGQQATAEQIALAIVEEINRSDVKLFATAVGNRIQLRDSVVKAPSMFAIDGVDVRGAAAYLGANITFSSELRGLNVLGQSLTVFDGDMEQTFTLVSSASQAVSGTPVVISSTARSAEIANAIKSAIDASALQLSTTVSGGVLGIRGLSDRVHPATALAFAQPVSNTGNPIEDAFKLTNYSLDVTLTDFAITTIDGASLTIYDGQVERTFEFDSAAVPGVQPGNLAVPVGANATPREMLAALKGRVDASDLEVEIVAAARSFRIAGTASPISVTTINGSVTVTGFGSIGTSPGFGIGVPADGLELADTVDDGQSFTISRGPVTVTFELDFDGGQEIPGSTLVPVPARTLDAVADAIAIAINNSQLALTAENIDAGRVTLSGVGTANVSLDLRDSVLSQLGIAGLPTPSAVVVPLDASTSDIATAYRNALSDFELLGVESEQIGDRVIVRSGSEDLRLAVNGTSVIDRRISDEVSNEANSDGLPSLVIFVGGGFDYGDAPSPYASTAAESGPRHVVVDGFALWRDNPNDPSDRPVTRDGDAQLPDADEDNGVRIIGALQPGFSANFEVSIYNEDLRPFYLDAWFDWNANGVFDVNESRRFGSVGTGRAELAVGTNVISVPVPSNAVLGPIYARFRLSEQDNLAPIGDASSGEVEDLRLVVSNNPYRNPSNIYDVNNSGDVTPLDALQVINAVDRNRNLGGGDVIILVPPILEGVNLPVFPDVNGDGRASALDAVQVINKLAQLTNPEALQVAEGEAVGYLPAANGVLVSGATRLGDYLIAEALTETRTDDEPMVEPVSTIPTQPNKTSVFDNHAVVELDSIVDALAEDAASARSEDENLALDQLFASL